MIRRLTLAPLCAALVLVAANARAAPLPQLWEAAQAHAPLMHSARAARLAGQSRGEQARALWRPDLVISGAAGYADASSLTRGAQFAAPGFGSTGGVRFETDVGHARSGNWSLVLMQPLYSPQRSARQDLLDISATSAELQWQAARQDLMLHLTEAYFSLALAEESLHVLRRQQQAVERILAETRDRFELGDLPVTDTYEAQARAEAVRAQVLAAETELSLRRDALADLTGISLPDGEARLPQTLRQLPPAAPLADWQTRALQRNPQLLLMERQAAAAAREAARHGRLDDARVDLVARVGGEHLSGDGPGGSASARNREAWAGVQFSLPLSTSGLRSAQEREAVHLLDKARADRDLVRQQIDQRMRGAWLGLSTGNARVQALQAGAEASQARLDATRLGLEAGDRSTLDLLNAENEYAAARLALDEARVQLLLHRLQLDALAGGLDESALDWAWEQTR
ncbi:TolC family protein [Pseudothauera rhizosphaerae]|uniref:Transporter n=1 Tax=Pseudothauera rhizosphaerae TaxID=2565932 RepID=A0A4S4ATY1_9RHOO|nr:TolC family protein [Pseudothauera rhizosphaerae]THF63346.1 transporter [Pseudothauera rhizosphaerae]